MTEEQELFDVYELMVVGIPPHRPRQRKDYPPRMYLSRKHKLAAIASEVRVLPRTLNLRPASQLLLLIRIVVLNCWL